MGDGERLRQLPWIHKPLITVPSQYTVHITHVLTFFVVNSHIFSLQVTYFHCPSVMKMIK